MIVRVSRAFKTIANNQKILLKSKINELLGRNYYK